MSSTLIFLHYNGIWKGTNEYCDYKVTGVAVDPNCNYEGLTQIIGDQIKVNTTENHVEMKYQVKDLQPPIEIDSDLSLMFYKELKSREHDYTKFPLCVTTSTKMLEFSNSLTRYADVARVGQLNPDKVQLLREAIQVGTSVRQYSIVDFANNAADVMLSEVECIRNKRKKKPRQREIEDETRAGSVEGEVKIGQLFSNLAVLKRTLVFIALAEKFSFKSVKSCRERYYVACVDVKCGWFVRSSIVGRSNVFKVRKMGKAHTCNLVERMNEQRQATSRIVSECIKSKFCNLKTVYTPADIMRDMKDDFGVVLNYKKAWRSRRKAVDAVRGAPDESYQMVRGYLDLLCVANPGSVVNVHVTDDMSFKFMFMSLFASIKGWHHCRPIVSVDGTFLKASYGGTLLSASVQDADAHILPLAWAIVDSENDLAYEWFFENLKRAIGTRPGMCIVSDRNESLMKAVTKVYPDAAQCSCIFHLGKNLKKHFKKNTRVVSLKFNEAAKAYNIDEFNRHMNELENMDSRVVEYLKGVGVEHWARAHCPQNRFRSMTSNAAESINAAIRAARELPVTTLLESLRAMQQKWSVANGDKARCTFTALAKLGHDMMEENYKLSFHMTVHRASDRVYQVLRGQSIFVVDLEKKECTCKRFQMDELPCAHALSVFRERSEDPIAHCSKYYYKESMVATYEEPVYPVGCEGTWGPKELVEDDIVMPPVGRVRCGRPKKKRKRSAGEYRRK